jgi:hypothetical protein
MFKHGGTYDVIMRYSSLTPKIVPDNEPAPRGIGMKIFGVEGEKIWGEDKKTQDWTLNNYPILELRDAKTTNEIADSLERNWDNPNGFVEELKARPDADVACRAALIPPQHSESTCSSANITNLCSGFHASILPISLPLWRLCLQIRCLPYR